MRYIPQTKEEQQTMLASVGIESPQSLFDCIPKDVRLKELPQMPEAMSESHLYTHMYNLAQKNNPGGVRPSFLGAGVYDHYVPTVVGHMASRQEFYTAYTPYQPEISQGTLTAIFEYQTMMCRLTGLDVSNASMYDTSSAAAEAMLMCAGQTRRNAVVLSAAMHPHVIETVKTYARFSDIEVLEAPITEAGKTNFSGVDLSQMAAVYVQSPNFFGVIEDMQDIAALAHDNGALAVASVDPLSLALLKSPGECGFDVAIGDTQSLGLKMNFGGPHCGFFVAKEKLMRKMPGRIVGQTTDKEGRRAFVLTLQAREQHIRREKATSNICSNQALCALMTTVHISLMGPEGLQECATQSARKSAYLRQKLIETGKFQPVFGSPFFREFALKCTVAPKKLNDHVKKFGFIGGYDLGHDFPQLENCILLAVTERRTREEIDSFVERMAEI